MTPRLNITEIEAARLRLDFRAYVREAWPIIDRAPLKWGYHLDAICDHLVYVSLGDVRFLLANMPPRSGKSSIISVLWPTWDWTAVPQRQWLTGSYAIQLSQRDALKSRRLLDSSWYQERWPLPFMPDEKLKRMYSNVKGGRRVVTSTDATSTGEGGDILLLDDPHNASEVESETQRKQVIDFWDGTFSSRMNDQNIGAWVAAGQLTHPADLFAHIRETFEPLGDVVQLVLPNEFDPHRRCVTRLPRTRKVIFKDTREKKGALLMPERLNEAATARLRKTLKDRYNLQYQQNTTGGAGNIITKDKWIQWVGEPPEVDQIITVWDTSYGQNSQSDWQARTDWGIWSYAQSKDVPILDSDDNPVLGPDGEPRMHRITLPTRNCAILLGAWRDKCQTHVLRKEAKAHYRRVRPDYTLIEKKVSGIDLIQDFRRAGIRGVRGISIDHGGRVSVNLEYRLNMVSEIFEDGCVFYLPTRRAMEVIDEVAAFPHGLNDDYVSTVTMALQWCRRRGELTLWEDERDDGTVRLFKATRRHPIYG